MKYILPILAVLLLIVAVSRSINAKRHRRRRRKASETRITVALYVVSVALVLVSLVLWLPGRSATSTPETTTQATTTPPETTQSPYGWKEENGVRFYLMEDGSRATGWQQIEGKQYLFNDDGTVYTGWKEENGVKYYFKPDGSMARGQVEIEGQRYFFTSTGANILLVNPWNAVPEGYEPELVDLSIYYAVENSRVDQSCYDALIEMIDACNAEAPRAAVVSSYRTHEYQTKAYESKVRKLMADGLSEEDAKREAATVIAFPGTSEHQLGLAVDIVDTRLWALEEEQADLPAQQWLMQNSWRFGFILRYPKDRIDSTGIIYEPWHYRYVGKEVAKEIYESGMTLEEYIQSLTEE